MIYFGITLIVLGLTFLVFSIVLLMDKSAVSLISFLFGSAFMLIGTLIVEDERYKYVKIQNSETLELEYMYISNKDTVRTYIVK